MAIGRKVWQRVTERCGDTGRMLLAFIVVDLVFKLVIVPAYLDLSVGGDAGLRAAALGQAVVTGSVAVLCWLVALALAMRPVRRWKAASAGNADAVARAGISIHRLPQLIAALWSIEWVVFVAVVMMRQASVPSHTVIALFLGTMALGPIPIAHGLAVHLLAPVVRDVSLRARARGVKLEARAVHLRSRLALYSLCIGVAPTLYMAALVHTVREHPLRITHLFGTNALFCTAIAIFACLSAALLASTITRPVSEMAEVMDVLTTQGDVSRVSRLPVHHRDEIGELAELTNTMLDRLEIIAHERMKAVASLSALNQTLEKRVEERTAELVFRSSEMRLVLDNVGDGLVVIDPSGQMPALLSKALVDWFGTPEPGEPFYRFLGRRAPAFAIAAELGWGQVVDGILPLDVTLAQMPTRLECDGRQYQVSYDPIANDPSGRILVVVADETTQVEREAAEHEKRETMAILDHLLGERGVFLGFMEEASDIVASLRTADVETADARRALHTLKGNTLFFGLESIARLCHSIETALSEGLSTRFLVTKLSERWERLHEQVGRIVGEKQRRMVEISPEDYERLECAIRAGVSPAHVAEMLHGLKLEPASVRLDHLAEQARRIGQRLQKITRVEVIHDGLRLDEGWSRLWSALVHPVRNAIDHGIETPEERERASKPKEGRITLRAERREAGIIVEIEDDGRGISWCAIASSCASRGVPAATHDDLVAALFADGLSTAARVTDISGRGVGMGALRSAVLALDGVIEVSSEAGRGTRLRMTFPLPGSSATAQGRSSRLTAARSGR